MENKMQLPPEAKIIISVVVGVVLLVLFLIFNPFVIVSAGHRGVVMNWGAVSDNIMGEGIHWRIPIQQSVHSVNIQTVKMEVKAIAYSKDIQTVDSLIALNYHQQADKVNFIYQTLGTDFEANIIAPAVQESVKAATAKYTAQELVEKREMASDDIKTLLGERLQSKGIIIDAFSILNFDFSDTYEAAIEAKQAGQQNALKAENELERVKMEAEQRVAQAKAEAEAIRIQAEAVTSQGGEDYVQLQAILKWDGKLPTTLVPGSAVPFITLDYGK
jgi:regulator of protease activity HflC (stomatin/prohibitin superfamily)